MKHWGILKMIMLLLVLVCLTACGSINAKSELPKDSSKIKIVTTVFPPFDFVRQVAGNKAEIVMLLSPGMESHSYEPTPKDMIAIKECDLFLYGGGESDTWVEDLLDGVEGRAGSMLTMMECIEPLTEEHSEGMQERGIEKVKGHMHEATQYDEHVWTDPRNAAAITREIVMKLGEIDPENKEFYEQNGAVYQEELKKLEEDFLAWRKTIKEPTLVFGDRFPFLYFAKAYDLECYAAFPGCSAETEASAKTMAFLIDQVKDKKLGTVFYLELSNAKVADAIAEAGEAKTAMLHSCHNISKEELNNGVTYLSLMKQNLEVLKQAIR